MVIYLSYQFAIALTLQFEQHTANLHKKNVYSCFLELKNDKELGSKDSNMCLFINFAKNLNGFNKL